MIVSDYLYIGIKELSQTEWRKLFQKLRYTDRQGNVYEPWRYRRTKDDVLVPRGAWNFIPGHVEYEDRRVLPKAPAYDFKLQLDAEIVMEDGRTKTFKRQEDAVRSMLEQEQGLIIRQPGTGKSNIVLAFASVSETRVLVLVHTEDILQQWIEFAERAVPDARIGVIRQEEQTVGEITIATVQTFGPLLAENRDWKRAFGAVVLDEAHHASAKTFEEILNRMNARYRFGVTASPTRADGKHAYMRSVIGPVIHKLKFESPIPVTVVPIKTGFNYPYRGSFDWSRLVTALVQDDTRNQAIAKAADLEVKSGQRVLILSRRIEHLQRIAAKMKTFDEYGSLFVGKWEDENGTSHTMSREMRRGLRQSFIDGEIRVLLATQLADEALDVPALSRIFLVHPGKHDGRLIQQIGRTLREYPDKLDAVVYDVVDDRVGPLRKQWMQRKQFYDRVNFKIKKRKREE